VSTILQFHSGSSCDHRCNYVIVIVPDIFELLGK